MSNKPIIIFGSNEPITNAELNFLYEWKVIHGINSKKALYTTIKSNAKLHLPDFKCQAVTTHYLDGILLKKNFSLPIDEVKKIELDYINTTAEIAYFELESWIKNNHVNFNFGFTPANLPNKSWLIDVLYSLNSTNVLFKQNFDKPVAQSVDLLVTDVNIADADFRNAKHPAYYKYLHLKQAKRNHKRSMIEKHKTSIYNSHMNRLAKHVETLDKLNVPNASVINNNFAVDSSYVAETTNAIDPEVTVQITNFDTVRRAPRFRPTGENHQQSTPRIKGSARSREMQLE